jgi:nitroreductase
MHDVIKIRRSIRRFKKQAVPDVLLKDVIEADTWAPSGLNKRP